MHILMQAYKQSGRRGSTGKCSCLHIHFLRAYTIDKNRTVAVCKSEDVCELVQLTEQRGEGAARSSRGGFCGLSLAGGSVSECNFI